MYMYIEALGALPNGIESAALFFCPLLFLIQLIIGWLMCLYFICIICLQFPCPCVTSVHEGKKGFSRASVHSEVASYVDV
jgi:hypothetical protein